MSKIKDLQFFDNDGNNRLSNGPVLMLVKFVDENNRAFFETGEINNGKFSNVYQIQRL